MVLRMGVEEFHPPSGDNVLVGSSAAGRRSTSLSNNVSASPSSDSQGGADAGVGGVEP